MVVATSWLWERFSGCVLGSEERSVSVPGWGSCRVETLSFLHFPFLLPSQAPVEETVPVLLLLLSPPPPSSSGFLFPVPSEGSMDCEAALDTG